MSSWNSSLSLEQEDLNNLKIKDSVNRVIDHLRGLAPNAKILLSGYDYPRFMPEGNLGGYQKIFERIGKPDPIRLAAAAVRMSDALAKLRENKNVFYIQHYGVLNFHFGSEIDPTAGKPHSPGESLSPKEISTADHPERIGGFPAARQRPAAMMSIIGFGVDSYHPGSNGLAKIADHALENFILDWL